MSPRTPTTMAMRATMETAATPTTKMKRGLKEATTAPQCPRSPRSPAPPAAAPSQHAELAGTALGRPGWQGSRCHHRQRQRSHRLLLRLACALGRQAVWELLATTAMDLAMALGLPPQGRGQHQRLGLRHQRSLPGSAPRATTTTTPRQASRKGRRQGRQGSRQRQQHQQHQKRLHLHLHLHQESEQQQTQRLVPRPAALVQHAA